VFLFVSMPLMNRIQIFAVAVALLAHIMCLSHGMHIPVPQPAHGKVHLCSTKDCLDKALQECKADHGLLITMIVSNFAHEPYVPLYLGWLQYLFSGSEIGRADGADGGQRQRAAHADDLPFSSDGVPQLQHFVLIEPEAILSPAALHRIETEQTFKHAAGQGVNEDLDISISLLKVYETTVLLFCEPELQDTSLNWVFVALQHGYSACIINSLANMRVFNPHLPLVLPRVLVHLNHEKPWETNPSDLDFTFHTIEELRNAYALFPLVMRNYYFRELDTPPSRAGAPAAADVPLLQGMGEQTNSAAHSKTRTLFFPLGPSYYGYLVGNSTQSVHAPASQRMISCYFAGRKLTSAPADQTSTSVDDSKQDKSESTCSQTGTGAGAGISCAQSANAAVDIEEAAARFQRRPFQHQRHDMFNMLEQREQEQVGTENEENGEEMSPEKAIYRQPVGLASCEFNVNALGSHDKQNYISYLHTLSNVIFALCPAGNNPETFRIYEAMERGAIPVLIRSAEVDIDFIGSEMWSDQASGAYPGPVFDTWDEADRYLAEWAIPTHDAEEVMQLAFASRAKQLDALQSDVMSWYKNLKLGTVQSVANALHSVFS